MSDEAGKLHEYDALVNTNIIDVKYHGNVDA